MTVRVLLLTFMLASSASYACEFEMSKSSVRFLRTLRTGITEGVVTPEDLNWMIEQPAPVLPVRAPRIPENLSFIQKLRREIPHITPKQWPHVVNQVREVAKGLTEERALRQGAIDTTKYIYQMLPSGFNFPRGEMVARLFVSSRGEPFIVTYTDEDSYLYNFATGSKLLLPEKIANGARSIDFFETANGELLFAMISTKGLLTVLNLNSGDTILTANGESELGAFSPLIYEEQGALTVSIGNPTAGVHQSDAHMAFYKVQLQQYETFPSFDQVSYIPVARLKNGHLYSRSIVGENDKMSIQVVDMTTGQELFHFKDLGGDGVAYSSALLFDTSPKLLITKGAAAWYKFDPTTKAFIPLITRSHLSHTINHGDQVLLAKLVDRPYKSYQLQVLNVLTNEEKYVDVGFKSGHIPIVAPPDGVQTPKGMLIHSGENRDGVSTKFNLYNLDTDELVSMSYLPNVTETAGLFYNPTDGRILMINRVGESDWQVHQVYGPERHRR